MLENSGILSRDKVSEKRFLKRVDVFECKQLGSCEEMGILLGLKTKKIFTGEDMELNVMWKEGNSRKMLIGGPGKTKAKIKINKIECDQDRDDETGW